MISVHVSMTPAARRATDSHFTKPMIEALLDEIAHEGKKELEAEIPKDTEKAAHSMEINRLPGIREVGSTLDWVKYIILGHHVLTTEKSRRYWFWLLNTKYGGAYQRKTKGEAGYVPPNRFNERAYYKLIASGAMDRAIAVTLNAFY